MTLERQVVTGLKWGATAKFSTQIVAWAATLVVIRLLTPADYGLMALSAVVTSIIGGVAELGLGASLIQARQLTRDDIARVGGALITLNATCAALVCLTAPLFAAVFNHPQLQLILQVSSIQFLLSALAAIPEAIAYRELRFKWLALTDIVHGVSTSAFTLGLALVGAGVWALVLGSLLGFLVRAAMLTAKNSFVRPTFALGGIGQLVRFGGAWSAARFAWQLGYDADVVIAGRFLAQEAVGVYSVAVQLANLPLGKIMGLVNRVAFPAMAKLQDDLPRMRLRLLESARLLGLSVIPMLWGISAVTPEFVEVVLGDAWRSAVLPLQLIALVAPLRLVATLFATALAAMGRADVELVNTLVSLGVTIAVFLVGVRWGVNGLGVAYVVAVGFSAALNLPRTARTLGIGLREVGAVCLSSLVAASMMIGAVSGARLILADVPAVWRLPMLVAVGIACYLGVLFVIDRSVLGDMRRVATVLRAPS